MSDSEEGQVMDNTSSHRSDGEVTPNSPAATPASDLSDNSHYRLRGPVSNRRHASRATPTSRSPSHSVSGSEKHRSYSRSRSRTPPKNNRPRSISPPYRRRNHPDGMGRDRARSRSRSRTPVNRLRGGRGGQRRGGGNGYPRGGQVFNRDNPEPSRCLGVFGLGLYTQERDLRDVFGRYGPIDDIQVVYDRQTRRSRGFAFIYFKNTDDAVEAKDRCNGLEVDGRRIRVDFSITERAHSPTPGIYLGKPTSERYRGHRNNNGSPHYPRRRSPSPFNSRRSPSSSRRSPSPYSRRRSHSRSRSPRRY